MFPSRTRVHVVDGSYTGDWAFSPEWRSVELLPQPNRLSVWIDYGVRAMQVGRMQQDENGEWDVYAQVQLTSCLPFPLFICSAELPGLGLPLTEFRCRFNLMNALLIIALCTVGVFLLIHIGVKVFSVHA